MTKSNITHLILSEGGLKGIIYAGVLQYLYIENLLENIKYIAGTSIGAFFAFLFALKFPIENIQEFLYKVIKNIEDEKDGVIYHQTFSNLFMKNGIVTLDFLFTDIITYLKTNFGCEDMSFIDFVKRTGVNLYISTTNVNTGNMQMFCLENTPNAMVLNAIKASMSIPFLFEPIEINGELYFDGCVSSSLSLLNVFQDVPAKQKLEILLNSIEDEKDEEEIYQNNDFLSHITKVFQTLYVNHFNKPISIKKENVILFENIPYSEILKFHITNNKIHFDITTEDYDKLVLTGFKGASDFFQNVPKNNI
jgi:predicted patatin/cPLA2 family phospholipase